MISRTEMYNQAAIAISNFGTNTSTTEGSYNLFVGGTANDIVKNDTDHSVILTGIGDDNVLSTGDNNTIEDTSGKNTIIAIGNSNKIKGGTGADSIAVIGNQNIADAGDGSNKIALLGDSNKVSTGKDTDYIYTLDFAIRNKLFTDLSGYLNDFASEITKGVHINGLISNTTIIDDGGYNYVGLNVADGKTNINIDDAKNDFKITSGADWIK